ncbi:helix-turn-helix transcriptional regulator [Actinoallomurus sp. NPDC052274]|uniref:helix-turn-helix domain-containing protein n=1 Tax=Actinoallomurus sp. NPDC052274 TaxID=3155420 RepID=UPI00343150AC
MKALTIPPSLWNRPDVTAALSRRDIGQLFRLVRQYAGASQTQLAIACGMTQGKISEYMKRGGRQVLALDVFERIADGLEMPDDARMTLGLAPRSFTRFQPCGWLADPRLLGSLGGSQDATDEDGESVQRRTFHRLAAAGLFEAVLGDVSENAPSVDHTEPLVMALTGHSDAPGRLADPAAQDLSTLWARVASVKRDFQECRYSTLPDALTGLLSDIAATCETLQGDDKRRVYTFSAETYQVAAGVLSKLGEEGLAWLAADQSMRAARRSEDPVTVGSSARSIANRLVQGGHFGAAATMTASSAARLDREIGEHTPESLSVYGMLLLRSAEAAGLRNDRATVATMLDEAESAARRLGGDHNYRWTAFGPTNVRLHRVNISASLGDAGQALAEARRVDLHRIPTKERKAVLLLDTSRALLQWGRHEKAYEILRAAERLAPEEVSARPVVHRLVRDLHAASPPTVRRRLGEFATRIGVAL